MPATRSPYLPKRSRAFFKLPYIYVREPNVWGHAGLSFRLSPTHASALARIDTTMHDATAAPLCRAHQICISFSVHPLRGLQTTALRKHLALKA